MKKVYISRMIDEDAVKLLREKFHVDVNEEDRELTREELLDIAPKYDAILTMLSNKIDKEVIDLAKNVKIFADYSVGFNNFDVAYAKEKGIYLTNTPDVLTNATADLAFSLLLGVARRVVESDDYVRMGLFKEWKPKLLLGKELFGKTLGIVGFGRIGQAVAERAKGFGLKVIYYNRSRKSEVEELYSAKYVSFENLLEESDFISIHTPLSDETYHLFGKEQFDMMKDDAVLVNTSRGPVIDEEALIETLQSARLFGVGLDVYENEPVVPKSLIGMKNVVTLPHIGSATEEARRAMAFIAVNNIIQALDGEVPNNLVYDIS
ncbi:MAG: D-glycerate dehydrogenase [Clostridiales bacterium]|nr:D-glycerate dehydrogenase [Clostridiales bacterium]